ncbi:MAG TPA: transcription antitermination factor NusB [Polyangiaceae bacterium]|nr:transcription antitermination factor NusB [Polyangiaceae bacterium]
MGARSTAREAALQMLYALDTTGLDVERVIADYWKEAPGDPEGREYANQLVRGVAANLERADSLIEAASQNWRVGRMSRVDRNVLRIGAWELAERLEVPRAVILDEAVETAKRFGNEDSGAFVNGVLDRIADDCDRHDTDAVPVSKPTP